MSEWAIIDRRHGYKRLGIFKMTEAEIRARYVVRLSRKTRRVEILAERKG